MKATPPVTIPKKRYLIIGLHGLSSPAFHHLFRKKGIKTVAVNSKIQPN
jgi:hypothetical protein